MVCVSGRLFALHDDRRLAYVTLQLMRPGIGQHILCVYLMTLYNIWACLSTRRDVVGR